MARVNSGPNFLTKTRYSFGNVAFCCHFTKSVRQVSREQGGLVGHGLS